HSRRTFFRESRGGVVFAQNPRVACAPTAPLQPRECIIGIRLDFLEPTEFAASQIRNSRLFWPCAWDKQQRKCSPLTANPMNCVRLRLSDATPAYPGRCWMRPSLLA